MPVFSFVFCDVYDETKLNIPLHDKKEEMYLFAIKIKTEKDSHIDTNKSTLRSTIKANRQNQESFDFDAKPNEELLEKIILGKHSKQEKERKAKKIELINSSNISKDHTLKHQSM